MTFARKALSTTAICALVAIAPVFHAQAVESDQVEEAQPASQSVETALAASQPPSTTLRRLTATAAGLYSLSVRAGFEGKIKLNGVLVFDGAKVEFVEGEDTKKAVFSVPSGESLLEIEGPSDIGSLSDGLLFGPVGAELQSLESLTKPIDRGLADVILASRSALPGGMQPLDSTGAANRPIGASSSGLPAAFGTQGNRAPFSIGGGSSQASRQLNSSEANTQQRGMNADAGSMPSSQSAMARRGGGVRNTLVPAISGGTTTTGGLSAVGSGGSGSTAGLIAGDMAGLTNGLVTGPNGTGSTGAPGTPASNRSLPTPTPVAAPAPTPTPTPPALPPQEMASISPLSPPEGVALTEAIQLTSAGNQQGIVPDSGTTLFGAVTDNSMFDIVDVAIAPSNRTTTVDVGTMTGQFAVRLFPEDFAQSENITVTLTGASSASDEVTATPISYQLSAMPATDGIGQALSRVTFGPTPALYARLRAIGFNAYIEEQLNPATVVDTAFESLGAESLLNRTTTSENQMFDGLMAFDIAHAAFSEKQLQEVMGHFWANHFHASTKNTEVKQQNIIDREFYRANALGNFADMLLYSARSPLMSQYLDNDQNRVNRINENYAREILELHSVGVDAGYTDEDIIEVARIFTGWFYESTNPDANGVAREYEFWFHPENHDEGDKTISFLNTTIAGRTGEDGVREGEELISILSQHESTRNFVCQKIVRLLVSDDAPADLTAACAAAWLQSGGEVTAMLRAVLLDPSFISQVEYQRSKAKTPFEYSISAIRAFGATPQPGEIDRFYSQFRQVFEEAGQDILKFTLPTGFPEVASAWVNSATMNSMYNEMIDIAEQRERYGIDLLAAGAGLGLETAEEFASYLLTVATANAFTRVEFEELVDVLKGDDGIFEPLVEDETRAMERALGLIIVTPSFTVQ